jgi:hypothetical protein
MLNDAVKKGCLCQFPRGGLSGAFIPVSEDLNIAEAARAGSSDDRKLEAMTSVCSVGLDMVAIPGEHHDETIAAMMADEMAIGVINHKTTATRLIPVPGKSAGENAFFGGLLGESGHHAGQQRRRAQSASSCTAAAFQPHSQHEKLTPDSAIPGGKRRWVSAQQGPIRG